MVKPNADGFFPYTPAVNMLFGLVEAVKMMEEEGMENVFSRHQRLSEATRRAVRAWDLEIQCSEPKHYSPVVTGVRVPQGKSADAVRKIIDQRFNMSLGAGLSKLADQVFRIGHLGDFNELMLAGALSGVEMGLHLSGIKVAGSGVDAALTYLRQEHAGKN
jgi:alanine-glyoxylate transaminase/serine-glyoxylate transaminase/serine-pyruvate transaminase